MATDLSGVSEVGSSLSRQTTNREESMADREDKLLLSSSIRRDLFKAHTERESQVRAPIDWELPTFPERTMAWRVAFT